MVHAARYSPSRRSPLLSVCVVAAAAGAAHGQHQHEPPAGDGSALQDQREGPMEVVDLPEPAVSVRVEGGFRVITTNGLPDHVIGEFPNAQNPNALRALNREFRIPLNPQPTGHLTPSQPEFGVALNGVVFDSGTGEFWTPSGERGFSEWNYDAASTNNQNRFGVDFNHGHVQPTGKYHYHGVPTALVEALGEGAVHDGHAHQMIQLGWAFDGYPVYAPFGHEDPNDLRSDIRVLSSSYRLRQGTRPASPQGPGGAYDGTYSADYEYVEGLGDLDQSNGRAGVTPEFPDGTYYYVITDAFPSIPRTWVGTPGPEFGRKRPGGGPAGMPGPRTERAAPAAQAAPHVAAAANTPKALPVNPSYFIEEALAAPIVTEERSLANGTMALCYVIQTYSEPHEHQMGPWSPTTIDEGAEAGGIWIRDGAVYDVDGNFIKNIGEFYGDSEWLLYREDGSVRVTDTKEAFEAAARPDVDPRYHNHVVEGRPEWITRKITMYVIPVQPVYQDAPTNLQGGGPPGDPRGGPDRDRGRPGPGAPPPGERPARNHDAAGGGGGGAGGVGVAFNGVKFDPPAPLHAILAAHTIAPFDDAGGHINPHAGYHYHAATGKTKEIAQPDGHAPMIGYSLDGFGLFAHLDATSHGPVELDECGGHFDDVRGYHYHVGAAGSNQIIKAFRGVPGTMVVVE